ncbi:MAG: bifunctional oligoribonuclease/PAP phosphatase NrnA [Calditrichaeota bacterium]|nr:MAG: bifunctional oligoribonuclease/PAP phosphatase NrnA [Calditrichota bacterium]
MTIEKRAFENVKACLERGQRFVLTTHVNPDGDGLGSEAALALFLESLGKDAYIYNSSPVPENYRFLDPEQRMQVYDSNTHRETLLTADYIVVLDISDWNRLRQVGMDFRDVRIPKICIDHHPPYEKFGDIRLVDVEASSTGEIVYELIKYCGGTFTREIAEALYVSILTDTGSFRFTNTTANALRAAAELVECGVNPQQIYRQVYERLPVTKVRLFGYVLSNLKFEQNGKVAWVAIPAEVMKSVGARQNDTEGFADYPRVIEGVEVSLLFLEVDRNRTKISFRSKGSVPVNVVAQKFGGGGHPFASGVLIEGKMEEYIPKVLEEVSRLFRASKVEATVLR